MGRKRKVKTVEIPVEASGEQIALSAETKKLVLKQTDGKLNKKGARSLYELMGEKFSTPYDQQTEAEYESYLNTLNLTDLEVHASQMGVIPKDDRHQTIANLLRQFRLVSSDYYNTAQVQPVAVKVSDKVIRILSEGR